MTRIFSAALALTLFFSANAFASYHSELKKVTQSSRMYSGTEFDAEMIAQATLFTEKFRKSFAEKHIAVEHLDATEAARFFAEQMKKQTDVTEVTLFLYTKKDYKKVSLGDDSFWKFRLELPSGETLKPSNVELLPSSPYLAVMYPDSNRWSNAYRVTFPKQDLHGKVKLHLQSVVGESTLSWNVK